MRYSRSDLRLADVFAIGCFIVGLGLIVASWGEARLWTLQGGIYACLGMALGLKIRELKKNGGHERDEWADVPER